MRAANIAVIDSSSRKLSGHDGGRKESQPHVFQTPDVAGTSFRRRYPFSALLGKMLSRLRQSTRIQRNTRPMIPQGLSKEETAHYETLITLAGAKRPGAKPRVVVITDLAKDYDDLAALVVLKELHRLGVIELLGFIANLMPPEKRTRFGRGALDSLGLQSIPIAQGTSGFPPAAHKKHEELPYEFACGFMASDSSINDKTSGQDLLGKICQDAKNKSLTLVLISSLEDIYTFSKAEPDLLKKAVKNIVLQGGYTISADGKLEPDEAANNNRYDIDAAKEFHSFMQKNNIESTVYTKVAAFATPLTSELFSEMEKTTHPIGIHLRKVQVAQDLLFYKTASNKDVKKRFAPFMDQKWYLENKTTWFDTHSPDEPYPQGDAVIPWLTKVVVYDALAALGAAGSDVLDVLKVLTPSNHPSHPIHKIVGFAGPPNDPGVDPEQMASVLSALLKGSLLSYQQQTNS